ncbi:hypothetical protein E8E11_005496 [Didymella keratinophila]|nr:hypothetical protein E8E11_005496 [Didymella keratinophila]
MQIIENFYAFADRFNRTIHITQALLVLAAFIVGCALMANTSMPRSRSTTLVLVYSIKPALFLLYQYLTTHKQRFKRWASLKANFVLDTFDCLLWFTAFIISCMGGGRSATVALLLSCTYFVTAIGINWPKWRASKKLPVRSSV